MRNEKLSLQLSTYLENTWDLGRQMGHSYCAERDGTYIALSCVLFSIVVDSESHLHYYVQKQVQLLSLLSMNKYIAFL
jgi:hypothetical protein